MEPIKLVVSDIDGTLICRGEEFPEAVFMEVMRLKEMGIGFTFASGRLPYMISPYLKKLGLSVPVCACNGTLIYQGDTILESHPLNIGIVREAVEKALSEGMTVLYGINGAEFCMEENEAVRRKREARGSYHKIRPLAEGEWDSLLVDKVNILDEKNRIFGLDPFFSGSEKALDITHYGSSGLEIVAAGYGKGYGIKRLSEYMNIPLSRILAIGDNENDKAMLKAAGIGGVVGNGTKEAKACADVIANGTGGEGAAEIIRRVCFNTRSKDNACSTPDNNGARVETRRDKR